MKKALACVIFLLWTAWGLAAGIREGMTRAQVEAELGKPLSSLVQGEVLILNYPNRGRVELVQDRVTRVVRVRHQDDPATPEEVAAAAAAKEAAAERAEREAEAAEEAKREKEHAAAEAEWAKSNAQAQRNMEAAVEKLTTEHESQRGGGTAAADLGLVQEASHFWLELAIGLLVQIGIGMVILKLAFRWTDVHADWGQMLWPAVAAALAGAVVRAIAFAAWNTTECFHLDDAISYFALLITLLKTTHACTWQRAVGVAAATKLMSIVVWVFLSVAISRLLFA